MYSGSSLDVFAIFLGVVLHGVEGVHVSSEHSPQVLYTRGSDIVCPRTRAGPRETASSEQHACSPHGRTTPPPGSYGRN